MKNSTPFTYRAEFASGCRATLTISPTAARIDWTPAPPALQGEAMRTFLATYRHWRNECISDFAARAGLTIAVVDA